MTVALELHSLHRAKKPLQDGFDRKLNYLRLAVTDRCDLRCVYCMPPEGIISTSHDAILRYEEIHRLIRLFRSMGINKLRITGGEPFVRKGFMEFIEELAVGFPLLETFITTNGVAAAPFLQRLKELGIGGINLSMDALSPGRYGSIARRDSFSAAWKSLTLALALELNLKINVVVIRNTNEQEIPGFIELARNHSISVRFIEQMPFNGSGFPAHPPVSAEEITHILESLVCKPMSWKRSGTALEADPDGFRGSLGVIPASTRSFCGACNRIRITSTGGLQTCLYGGEALNLKELIRSGASDKELEQAVRSAIHNKVGSGRIAETARPGQKPSMAAIGG